MTPVSRTFYKSYPLLICRSFHVSHSMHDDSFKRLMFKLNGFYKYGLLQDDLLRNVTADVKEAIRRLPEKERLERTYRAIRAHQAEINHSILPKEQWTKFEDNHFYLRPYLEEVLKEKEEIKEWEANH